MVEEEEGTTMMVVEGAINSDEGSSRIWGWKFVYYDKMGMNPTTNGENGGCRFGGFRNGRNSRHLEEIPR